MNVVGRVAAHLLRCVLDIHGGAAYPEEASSHTDADKAAAIALVRNNVRTAATVVRALTDEQSDRLVPTEFHWEAPLTFQFFVEHHPIAHPYAQLENIRKALGPGD